MAGPLYKAVFRYKARAHVLVEHFTAPSGVDLVRAAWDALTLRPSREYPLDAFELLELVNLQDTPRGAEVLGDG